ncbi:hypothetical protein [Natrinema sp. SYSU A 869]|uniref:hypothetical protein n=1 Tax=Natrinema sp. SYSU A 869 TaxID=2871694 RepID=UPI001CA3B5B8|nr:hypothetical protein [Natrinema sp. SYSU A 869]
MTTDADHAMRVRLEEVLDDIKTLDGQLADLLTLGPAIRNLEETIEVYERFDIEDHDPQEGNQ